MSGTGAGPRILLVRHTAVTNRWRQRCYGATDVPLGTEGRTAAKALAEELAARRPALVFTSPLRRARFLAAHVARFAGVSLRIDARLAERNFGSWEGKTWDDIYADSGDAMMGMLNAPATFRPGGGETTFELRDRAISWLNDLPSGTDILAISHGGPIAALAATEQGLPPAEWPSLIPPLGGQVTIRRC